MIKRRQYQGQAPDSSFDAIEISDAPVRKLREFNKDNEGTLSETLRFNSDQRQQYQNQIERNQALEATNRRENFEFKQASEKAYFDSVNRNNQQKVNDAQAQYEAFTEKQNPLAELSKFSFSLAESLGKVKQELDKREEDKYYFSTMQGLTNGDIALAQAQEAELTAANSDIDRVASIAQIQGAPLETIQALKGLKGGARVGAAKALAESTVRRYPAALQQFIATSDEQIQYTDPVTGEIKVTSPRSAKTAAEISAVGQFFATRLFAANGLTNVNPAVVAPYFKKLLEHNQTVAFTYNENSLKALATTDTNKALVDLNVNITTEGALAIPQSIEQISALINPETMMPYGRAGAQQVVLDDLTQRASVNSPEGIRALEILRAYGDLPAPEYLRGNKDLTNADVFPAINIAIGTATRSQVALENAADSALDQQRENETTALLAEAEQKGIPSVGYIEQLQAKQIRETGEADPRLETLKEKSRNLERGIPEQRKDLEAYVNNNSLTSDVLSGFDPVFQNDPYYKDAAERGDALKAQVTEENSTFNTWLDRTSKGLEGIKDSTSLPSNQQPLVRAELEIDVLALAKEIQDASEKPITFDQALQQAMQQFTKMLSPLTTGVDITSDYATPISPDNLDVRAAKYYWDPIKKTFPNIFGGGPELNLDRLYELDNLVQQGGQEVFFTKPIITREQALAASAPNAPIPSIISRLRRLLPKGSTLSEFDLLQAQQRFHGVQVREKPYAQQTVEAQPLTPLQAELLYRTPTQNRTTRYGIDTGLGSVKERAGVQAIANNLGIDPIDLATIIDYETGGALTSGSYRAGLDIYGGDQGLYLGWIQFSPANAAKYGVRTGMTAAQQAEAVTAYLRDMGVRPGDPLHVIYQAIQAPAYVEKARQTGRNYLSDSNGPVGGHVKNILKRRARVSSWYLYQPGEQSSAFADPRYRSINSAPYDNV